MNRSIERALGGALMAWFLIAAVVYSCTPQGSVIVVTATPSPLLPTTVPTIPAGWQLGTICDERGCNGDTWNRPADGAVMVYVPAGEFEMGSEDGQHDERPVHTVALNGFWLDSTEVTNGQYTMCVEAGFCPEPAVPFSRTRDPYYGTEAYADYPVIKVDWYNAQDFCEWAGARLPTEAEWEYAARGSVGSLYPWGDEAPDCTRANFAHPDGGCVGDTTAVGSYPSGVSWCGAYDLGGNVWEWLVDVYGDYPVERQDNPTGAEAGRYRIMRGGSWFNNSFSMRGANRDKDPPHSPYVPDDQGFPTLGFRCARDAG